MLTSRQVDLRSAEDQRVLLDFFTEQGIELEPSAVNFAVNSLCEDWYTAWVSSTLNIWAANTNKLALSLSSWAQTVQFLYEMRHLTGIDEQIRRLGIPSHERLDTDLVIRVAGKYRRAGFEIIFEPNGQGCSDLLIRRDTFRYYVEIKRENPTDHKRKLSIRKAGQAVLKDAAPEIRTWLTNRQLRMEILFSRSFSETLAPAIIGEIWNRIDSVMINSEQVLNVIPGSKYIVLPRDASAFYEKGIHVTQVIMTGKPVQLIPRNMPVLVVFDSRPNLKALKQRLQKAARQLNGDAKLDPSAQGFIVMETSHGELAKETIGEYLSLVSAECLGVVLRSNPGYLVLRDVLPPELVETLMIAASP